MSELKANWGIAPEWATKFGKKHVVHDKYTPVWYNDERSCAAIEVPNQEMLYALQSKAENITFIEDRPNTGE